MSFAIFETGGKQYKASASKIIEIEKLDAEIGKTIQFKNVLLLNDNKTTEVGNPNVDGAIVDRAYLYPPDAAAIKLPPLKVGLFDDKGLNVAKLLLGQSSVLDSVPAPTAQLLLLPDWSVTELPSFKIKKPLFPYVTDGDVFIFH